MKIFSMVFVALSTLLLTLEPASAQYITVSTPTTTVSDSFHNSTGVNFGFNFPGGRGNGSRIVGLSPTGQLLPNLVFSQGGGVNSAFGGYDANSAGRFGFGNGNFSLGLNLSSGNTRTISNTTPMLTTQNGYGGNFFDGSFRPFTTGVFPIVGGVAPGFGPPPPPPGFYQPDNAVTRALASGQFDLSSSQPIAEPTYDFSNVHFGDPDSSASRGDLPVSEIKAQRAARIAQAKAEFEKAINAAESAELKLDFARAAKEYRTAMKMIDDKQAKAFFRSKIRAMSGSTNQDAKPANSIDR